jgi:hypothetical protein
MSGAIHPLPQYAFMAWCLIKSTGIFNFPSSSKSSQPINISAWHKMRALLISITFVFVFELNLLKNMCNTFIARKSELVLK